MCEWEAFSLYLDFSMLWHVRVSVSWNESHSGCPSLPLLWCWYWEIVLLLFCPIPLSLLYSTSWRYHVRIISGKPYSYFILLRRAAVFTVTHHLPRWRVLDVAHSTEPGWSGGGFSVPSLFWDVCLCVYVLLFLFFRARNDLVVEGAWNNNNNNKIVPAMMRIFI